MVVKTIKLNIPNGDYHIETDTDGTRISPIGKIKCENVLLIYRDRVEYNPSTHCMEIQLYDQPHVKEAGRVYLECNDSYKLVVSTHTKKYGIKNTSIDLMPILDIFKMRLKSPYFHHNIDKELFVNVVNKCGIMNMIRTKITSLFFKYFDEYNIQLSFSKYGDEESVYLQPFCDAEANIKQILLYSSEDDYYLDIYDYISIGLLLMIADKYFGVDVFFRDKLLENLYNEYITIYSCMHISRLPKN